MRIVGGRWRGRAIEAPEGRGHTRPTTDRTRESIASMVLAAHGLDLTGASVLDAFAGSGALGLELLSRGAQRATFVDSSRAAIACLRRNRAQLGVGGDVASVVTGDVMRLAARGLPGAPFSVVLLDPPYALDAAMVGDLLVTLREARELAIGALVVYEHDASAPGLPADRIGATVLRERRHGLTACELVRMGGTARTGEDPCCTITASCHARSGHAGEGT